MFKLTNHSYEPWFGAIAQCIPSGWTGPKPFAFGLKPGFSLFTPPKPNNRNNIGEENKYMSFTYLSAQCTHASTARWSLEFRIPFGWAALPLEEPGEHSTLTFSWLKEPEHTAVWQERGEPRLRITIALDVREEKRIEVITSRTGKKLGEFDIRYAYVFQVYEIVLNRCDFGLLLEEGLCLRMAEGTSPLWIFANEEPVPELLRPHICLVDEQEHPQPALENLAGVLASMASIQPFSWMEGCVLDGLMDLAEATTDARYLNAVDRHLAHYLNPETIVYEDPRSRPADGKFYGIEATLPMATVAKRMPDHPSVKWLIDFCNAKAKSSTLEGAIMDGNTLSAEGAYTIAYPLAVVSTLTGQKDLAQMSCRQLLIRSERLVNDGTLHLRWFTNGSHAFANWARAHAWYLLGFIRTIRELEQGGLLEQASLTALKDEFVRAAEAALRYRREQSGLWGCFIDQPEIGIDTSGSAGIAAALALGYKHGLLPGQAMTAARDALDKLAEFVTPDGLLRGTAQSNRGGEALQKSDYRVISQMAMGLTGQLIAAVR
jgi:unsaturated rhamnogalacturonyl hydrolase